MEKRSQMDHNALYLSKVLLSKANISSTLIVSFMVETHHDKGGALVAFQNDGMSCLAEDIKKLRRFSFCDVIDPGSIGRRAIIGVGDNVSS